jgi:hypothetical protein
VETKRSSCQPVGWQEVKHISGRLTALDVQICPIGRAVPAWSAPRAATEPGNHARRGPGNDEDRFWSTVD